MPTTRGNGGLDKVDSFKTLANVKPVANWLDARLNYAYKSLYKAKKKGDQKAIAAAQSRLNALRAKIDHSCDADCPCQKKPKTPQDPEGDRGRETRPKPGVSR